MGNNILGMRLSSLRLDKKLSQKQVAEAIHITPAAISAYENGIRQPSGKILTDLSIFFNVSPDYLLGYNNLAMPNCNENPQVHSTSPLSFCLEKIQNAYDRSNPQAQIVLEDTCINFSNIISSKREDEITLKYINKFLHFADKYYLKFNFENSKEAEIIDNIKLSFDRLTRWLDLLEELEDLKKDN